MRQPPLRILLADDHRLFAEMLARLLAGDARVEIVGIAVNGREAVDQTLARNPDLVVMDVHMPVLDGIGATRELRAAGSSAGVIVLSGADEGTPSATEALAAGANAFLRKESSISQLLDVFVEVASLSALLGAQRRAG